MKLPLKQLKNDLQNRKHELEKQMDWYQHTADHGSQELSQYDNHPADNATDLFDREKDQALHDHVKVELNETMNALEKLERGTYGICEQTGQAIPVERLLANLQHELLWGAIRVRPVEEDVLKGFEQYTDDDKENETEFDGEDAYQMVARFNDTSPEYDEETGDTDLYGSNGVEAFEGFLSTGIDGYHGPDSVHIEQNEHYKSYRESEK
ncbi:LOW QUALITY PROTEIN: DnaK suppressor protein [Bacillus sp. JCM 19046]|nr:LOW QUALITY PROTEIN: DnaK suppressor protein [Bacillus sp. JCM 19046]